MGFQEDDVIILQPTRVVFRKGIEQAIYLVELLDMPNAKLVVSHTLDDEGPAYAEYVRKWALRQGVPLHFIHNRLNEESGGRGEYSLWDVYPHADLITYPSIYEGFGNAFLEAAYFRKPILVNRYSVFIVDIEPKGFDVIEIDGYVTDAAVAEVRQVLTDPKRRKEMVDRNFEIARKHFSFDILRKELASQISAFFGIAPPRGILERIFGRG
jgi:glycosyltransferase involved in cell wall biosynthesis